MMPRLTGHAVVCSVLCMGIAQGCVLHSQAPAARVRGDSYAHRLDGLSNAELRAEIARLEDELGVVRRSPRRTSSGPPRGAGATSTSSALVDVRQGAGLYRRTDRRLITMGAPMYVTGGISTGYVTDLGSHGRGLGPVRTITVNGRRYIDGRTPIWPGRHTRRRVGTYTTGSGLTVNLSSRSSTLNLRGTLRTNPSRPGGHVRHGPRR